MSYTQFTAADVAAVKLWTERLSYDVISNDTLAGELTSLGILVRQDELSRKAGDQVKYHFLDRLSGKGFKGDETATGNEKALSYRQATLLIDEQREVVQIPSLNTIGQQRVTFNLKEDTYTVLRNWYREKMTVGILNQLTGNTATSITYDGQTYAGDDLTKITALNAATAPAGTGRIYRGNNSTNTTDQAVNADTTATAKISDILAMEAYAEKNRPYIVPLEGKNAMGPFKYLWLVHTDVFNQLLNDTTSPFQYRDMYYNMLAAGKMTGFSREMIFSQTKVISMDKMPYGVHSSSGAEQTNTRRGVFLGKEAGAIAFGQGFSDGKDTTAGFNFKMDTVDVGKLDRIAVTGIWGASKTVFNSVDRGTVATTHYVA